MLENKVDDLVSEVGDGLSLGCLGARVWEGKGASEHLAGKELGKDDDGHGSDRVLREGGEGEVCGAGEGDDDDVAESGGGEDKVFPPGLVAAPVPAVVVVGCGNPASMDHPVHHVRDGEPEAGQLFRVLSFT